MISEVDFSISNKICRLIADFYAEINDNVRNPHMKIIQPFLSDTSD